MKQFKPTLIGLMICAICMLFTSYTFGSPGDLNSPVQKEAGVQALQTDAIVINTFSISQEFTIAAVISVDNPTLNLSAAEKPIYASATCTNTRSTFNDLKELESKQKLIPPDPVSIQVFNYELLKPERHLLTDKFQKNKAGPLRTSFS